VRGALLTHHGVDSRVVLVPPGSLPYTSSGKLSRARTRQSYLTSALPTVAAMAA